MDWKECREREVKKVGPNKERARSLRSMAERRLEFIQGSRSGEGAEFIVANYYETIKELAAWLYINMTKSLFTNFLYLSIQTHSICISIYQKA